MYSLTDQHAGDEAIALRRPAIAPRTAPSTVLALQSTVGNASLARSLTVRQVAHAAVLQRCPECGGACERESDEAGDDALVAAELGVVAAERRQAGRGPVVQRWTWPWESEEDAGGGESIGGGSSESYGPVDAGTAGDVPGDGSLTCEEGPDEENACYEPPNYSPADRSWTCNVRCNVDRIEDGAVCNEFETGTGTGDSVKEACSAAKADANSKIGDGCKKRHCHGQCRGSQGGRGECR